MAREVDVFFIEQTVLPSLFHSVSVALHPELSYTLYIYIIAAAWLVRRREEERYR
jgi:hypothetical protein